MGRNLHVGEPGLHRLPWRNLPHARACSMRSEAACKMHMHVGVQLSKKVCAARSVLHSHLLAAFTSACRDAKTAQRVP